MRIYGQCPMGCGEYLEVGRYDFEVRCVSPSCPRPTALHELLKAEHLDHLVEVREDGWTTIHPLKERLDWALAACELDEYIRQFDGPPVIPGRYRVIVENGSHDWERLPDA